VQFHQGKLGGQRGIMSVSGDFVDRLDPEVREFILAIPKIRFSHETLPAIRKAVAGIVPDSGSPRCDVMVSEHWPTDHSANPPVRTLVYQPTVTPARPRPAILYLHGGGYMLGDPEQDRPICETWAAELDAVVVAPAYRLAPENPFPAAVDDATCALAWMVSHAPELGIDADRIAVAGESAGGGLAACLALRVRDEGKYRFCYQHLLFPMLDDRTAFRTDLPAHQGAFVWSNDENKFAWEALLGDITPGGELVPSYAAAARAATLSGLPDCFIAVGDLDLFFEENLDYAARLAKAGVRINLHVYPGAAHAFQLARASRLSRLYHSAAIEGFAQAFMERAS
jgi:acetyl esterase/lipase